MTIAVDFDGTIVTHEYPQIGSELPLAIPTLKRLKEDGHKLILWTVREGDLLDDAVLWCRERGLEFYAVNKEFPEEDVKNVHYSRKPKVDIWIDDRNVGGLPDWGTIYRIIKENRTYNEILYADINSTATTRTKRNWWFLP
ncbi:MAG: hypothetical protein IKW22_05290 [Bacteroidaceae bacterium]|nr:hypothetical protein [Bacteroidaceae bacterium]